MTPHSAHRTVKLRYPPTTSFSVLYSAEEQTPSSPVLGSLSPRKRLLVVLLAALHRGWVARAATHLG